MDAVRADCDRVRVLVLPGDMKTVIVTGGNTGLGYECAREIASLPGWHVIIACRNPDRAADAIARMAATTPAGRVDAMPLDLASLASVRRFVEEFARRDLPALRAIVCNAGLQIVSAPTRTVDGFETTFAV